MVKIGYMVVILFKKILLLDVSLYDITHIY